MCANAAPRMRVRKRSVGWTTNCIEKQKISCKKVTFKSKQIEWCVYYKDQDCSSLDKKSKAKQLKKN